MSAVEIAPYQIEAYNAAKASENRIHDDDVAQKFGFLGGLVPGVDVYAYMAHLPVRKWGRAWLEHGAATCRFLKPVYDGDIATVTATTADDEGLAIELTSRDEVCATGLARLPAATQPPSATEYRVVPVAKSRPEASEVTLAAGLWLNTEPFPLTAEFAAQYLGDVRETDPLYERERIAPPGMLLRLCNWVLTQNVVLGPWMHVGSTIRHYSAAHVGETLGVRARIADNREHKGHRFVDVDALVLAGARPVAHVLHTAIWRPRQIADT